MRRSAVSRRKRIHLRGGNSRSPPATRSRASRCSTGSERLISLNFKTKSRLSSFAQTAVPIHNKFPRARQSQAQVRLWFITRASVLRKAQATPVFAKRAEHGQVFRLIACPYEPQGRTKRLPKKIQWLARRSYRQVMLLSFSETRQRPCSGFAPDSFYAVPKIFPYLGKIPVQCTCRSD